MPFVLTATHYGCFSSPSLVCRGKKNAAIYSNREEQRFLLHGEMVKSWGVNTISLVLELFPPSWNLFLF